MALSLTQQTILDVLEKHSGCIVSYQALAKKVWGNNIPNSWKVMLSVEICRLREVPDLCDKVFNVSSYGYMFGCKIINRA